MNASDRTAIFETLPVHQAVYKQIIPAIVSQMIALIYNLADTYFVGILNDPHQTAAITIAAPSFVMLTAISNLFGVGGASAIARALGKKQPLRAKQIAFRFFLGRTYMRMYVFGCLFPYGPTHSLSLWSGGRNICPYNGIRKICGYSGWPIYCIEYTSCEPHSSGWQRRFSLHRRFFGRYYQYHSRSIICIATVYWFGCYWCRYGNSTF